MSNVDGADIHTNLADLDPETTLVVVSSKTFTTVETIANATEARRWLTARLGATPPTPESIVAVSDDEIVGNFLWRSGLRRRNAISVLFAPRR